MRWRASRHSCDARRLTAIVVAATGLAGCGGSAADEARRLQAKSVIEQLAPVQRYAVSRSQVTRLPAGTVERAFFRHWHTMQRHAGEAAARGFEPGLRRFVGMDLLGPALLRAGGTYRSARPRIASVRGGEAEALVVYDRITADAATRESMTFSRDPTGSWLIRHDPLLDQPLAEAAEHAVQVALDPLAQKLRPAAIRAGTRARGLQDAYLTQLGRRRPPERP